MSDGGMVVEYRYCTFEEFDQAFRDDHPNREPCGDITSAKICSHFYGAEVDGRIRGAIAFHRVANEPIDECEGEVTQSYIECVYISRRWRGRGIGTHLLAAAIQILIQDGRCPIGLGITSKTLERCYERLPDELKNAVTRLPTVLDDGYDKWEENDL